MPKRAELGQIVRYRRVLREVVSIGTGRSVLLREIGSTACSRCGQHPDVFLMEDSPLFQDGVEPVKTVDDA